MNLILCIFQLWGSDNVYYFMVPSAFIPCECQLGYMNTLLWILCLYEQVLEILVLVNDQALSPFLVSTDVPSTYQDHEHVK